MNYSRTSDRIHAIKVISKRETKSTLLGVGFYIMLTIAFLISSYILKTFLDLVRETGLEIMPRPLDIPLTYVVQLSAVYLAVMAALSITRERDQGTLEVLFYAPVDSVSYVTGKYVEHMMIFLVMLAFYIVYFFLASLLTGFGFSWTFFALLLLSIFLISCMISFGIFLSSIIKSIKTCIVVLIALMIALFGFQFLYIRMLYLSPEGSSVLVYAKNAVSFLNGIVQWISPLSYLARGTEALTIGSEGGYLFSILTSAVYSIVFLILAVAGFNRKGVKK